MLKKVGLVVVMFLFLMSFVSAFDTKFDLKTVQGGDITLRVLRDGKIVDDGIFQLKADSDGSASLNYSGSEPVIGLSISVEGVNFNGRPTIFFKDLSAVNKQISIDLTTATPTPSITDIVKEEPAVTEPIEETNKTETNDTVEANETTQNDTEEATQEETKTEKSGMVSSLTGFVVSNNLNSRRVVYPTIAIVAVALLVLVFVLARPKKRSFIVKPASSLLQNHDSSEESNTEIGRAHV